MTKREGIPNGDLFRVQWAPGVLRAAGDCRYAMTRSRFPLRSAEADAADVILTGIDDMAEAITGLRTFFHATPAAVGASGTQRKAAVARTPEQFSLAWWTAQFRRPGPQPISTAPTADDERPLLLYCPTMGGWHTGCFFEGSWRLWIDLEIELIPALWQHPPADPGINELRFRMGEVGPPG